MSQAAPGGARREPSKARVATQHRLTDAHFHLFNFIQVTDGLPSICEAMDEAGVDHAMVNGMGVCKKWSAWDPVEPKYYLDDDSRVYPYSATDVLVHEQVMSLPPRQRGRFHPFICGFDPTDRNAVDHIRRMLALYPGFWQGIGEVFARHDDLTALMYGEPGRANHVALDPVYDLAAELDMPVAVHSDITSVWETQVPIYLFEVAEALERHPRTKFIWCHAGISRRLVVPTLIADVRNLLQLHEQLRVDLSWVLYDEYLVLNGVPNSEWLALIEEFPDRFMIGSDVPGVVSSYVSTMTRYYVILDALRPEDGSEGRFNEFSRGPAGEARNPTGPSFARRADAQLVRRQGNSTPALVKALHHSVRESPIHREDRYGC